MAFRRRRAFQRGRRGKQLTRWTAFEEEGSTVLTSADLTTPSLTVGGTGVTLVEPGDYKQVDDGILEPSGPTLLRIVMSHSFNVDFVNNAAANKFVSFKYDLAVLHLTTDGTFNVDMDVLELVNQDVLYYRQHLWGIHWQNPNGSNSLGQTTRDNSAPAYINELLDLRVKRKLNDSFIVAVTTVRSVTNLVDPDTVNVSTFIKGRALLGGRF